MYIDDCQHTFEELARTVLPAHMERLKAALLVRTPMSTFAKPGVGPATLAKQLAVGTDFSGCYVLVDSENPIYVGISRRVLSRVRQHVLGSTHFDASFAYLIAQGRLPTPGTRNSAMETVEFRAEFDRAKSYLAGLSVAFVQIDNPLELYVFEAYAAMALRTFEWNTFRTH